MAISGYLPNEYEIVKYCDVDFSSQGVPSSVTVSQYDRKTVLLGIHLYNNSKPYYPPEGADAHLKVTTQMTRMLSRTQTRVYYMLR